MGSLDEAWGACARRLGLELREPTSNLFVMDNFGSMVRALGPRVGPPGGSVSHWMSGQWSGVPVLAEAHDAFKKKRTRVIAAIDPPLLVGLQMRGSKKSLPGLDGARHNIGFDPFDQSYDITARLGARVRELFASDSPGGWLPTDLPPTLCRLLDAAVYVFVTDNIVRADVIGVETSPPRLAGLLNVVTHVARRLRERRARVPRAPSELPVDVWRVFAERQRMAFDPLRMKISGDFGGMPAELRAHTSEGLLYAAALVSLPASLGVDLRVHGRSDSRGGGASDDLEDLELGDPAFDDAFLVHGSDPARVRALFGEPSTRGRALSVLGRTIDVVLRDTHLSSAFQAGLGDGVHLEWLLGELTELARALSRAAMPAGAAGPYRSR